MSNVFPANGRFRFDGFLPPIAANGGLIMKKGYVWVDTQKDLKRSEKVHERWINIMPESVDAIVLRLPCSFPPNSIRTTKMK